MTINQVLFQIRQSSNAFAIAYVRSTGKTIGSIGSGLFTFENFIDTNQDIIKLRAADNGVIKTLKISHLLSFNKKTITR